MFKSILLAISLIFISTSVEAQIKPVQDSLNLLSSKEQKDLSKYLLSHSKKVIVIIKNTDNIEEDAIKYGRENGGDIIIWYSPPKIRIETGTRLEGNLPDGLSNQIVRDHAHFLREKKSYQFFLHVTNDIYKAVEEKKTEIQTEENTIPLFFIILLIVGFIILFIICPECALLLLFFLNTKSDGKGDFSGGGSTNRDD